MGVTKSRQRLNVQILIEGGHMNKTGRRAYENKRERLKQGGKEGKDKRR